MKREKEAKYIPLKEVQLPEYMRASLKRLYFYESNGELNDFLISLECIQHRITSYNVCYTKLLRLDLRRDMSRNPLFDVMIVLQNMNLEGRRIEGIEIMPFEYEKTASKFDITLIGVESNGNLNFELEYSTSLFKEETIQRMIVHFMNTIKSIIENPECKLSKLNILTEEEQNTLLYKYNDTITNYPKDKTIQEIFEEQVKNVPERIAVKFEDKSLTYRELNSKANQLARVLREKGVTANSIVGLMVERSIEMIVGIMGILKSYNFV